MRHFVRSLLFFRNLGHNDEVFFPAHRRKIPPGAVGYQAVPGFQFQFPDVFGQDFTAAVDSQHADAVTITQLCIGDGLTYQP